MKKLFVFIFLFVVTADAYAQAHRHYNDRMISSYYGPVKKAVKITWKNAPDEMIKGNIPFDTVYLMAREFVAGHYGNLEHYLKSYSQTEKLSAQTSTEEFDKNGMSTRQEDRAANDFDNITYTFVKLSENKRRIDGISNRTGKKVWGGFFTWTPDKRIQDLATSDLFVIHSEISFDDTIPHTRMKLTLKHDYIMDAEVFLLSKTANEEIWTHHEVSTKPASAPEIIDDTTTHRILSRDEKGNITKQLILHSYKKEPPELVFVKYEYFE